MGFVALGGGIGGMYRPGLGCSGVGCARGRQAPGAFLRPVEYQAQQGKGVGQLTLLGKFTAQRPELGGKALRGNDFPRHGTQG